MKKKNAVSIVLLVMIVFAGVFVFSGVRRHVLMQNTLKSFGEFYAQDELAILKENVIPIHKTVSSENYKVSLKGVWAQEGCTDFVFAMNALNGSGIDENDIQYKVISAGEINEEAGNIALGEQEYKEGKDGKGLLEIKYFSNTDISEYNVKIEIENEQFEFDVSEAQKQKPKHFIPADETHGERLLEDIYLSPMSVSFVMNAGEADMEDIEINVSDMDGTFQKMELSEGFIGADNKTGNGKRYMYYLKDVYDVNKIDTISIGGAEYKLNDSPKS